MGIESLALSQGGTQPLKMYTNMKFLSSHRVDALRHFNKRRKLMEAGRNQPIQLGDWEDKKARAVICSYANPDNSSKKVKSQEPQMGSTSKRIE